MGKFTNKFTLEWETQLHIQCSSNTICQGIRWVPTKGKQLFKDNGIRYGPGLPCFSLCDCKIHTDCLILIGSWKISIIMIGCHKSYHLEQNRAHSWMIEGPWLYDDALQILYPFSDSLYLLTNYAEARFLDKKHRKIYISTLNYMLCWHWSDLFIYATASAGIFKL